MSEKSSDDEQIPMADEEDENQVTSAPQEAPNLTAGVPVLEVATPNNEDPPNVSQPRESVGTLLDNELSPEEQEEKARLIAQVLELQNTLDDLSSRVDNVKEENLRLRSENQVLGQYIGTFSLLKAENLMQKHHFLYRKSHGGFQCFSTS